MFCEAEAILNDRPVKQLSDDPNYPEPLSPNHILLMKGNPVLPAGSVYKNDLYLTDLFCKRWTQEYIPLLQERPISNEFLTWGVFFVRGLLV